MEQTILLSIPVKELQALIIDCVNTCLERNLQSTGAPESGDELLTVQEAADLLRLTVPTLYGKVHNREIPFSKQGKRLYFSKLDLTEWVKTGRQKTQQEIQQEADNYLVGKRK